MRKPITGMRCCARAASGQAIPAPLIGQDHRDLAMVCGDQGRFANAQNMLSQHARFLLEREEAERIITEMTAQVSKTWYDTVKACGVSTR